MPHCQRLTPRGGARQRKCLRMKGLPAPCILLPVVVVEAGLLEALVAAGALHEVVTALHAGSSVFLIGWLVCACGFALALRACGGFFCHKVKVTESEKKSRKKIDRSRPCHYDPTLTSPPFFRRSTLLGGEPLVLSKISKKKVGWSETSSLHTQGSLWAGLCLLFLNHVSSIPHIMENAMNFFIFLKIIFCFFT